MALASLSPPKRVAVERIAPLPTARPKPVALAAVLPRPRPAGQTIVTASAAPVVDNRGLRAAKVEAGPALPPPIVAGTRFETASLDPANTGSTADQALAYAADAQEPLAARTRPMGSRLPHMPAEARVIPASSNSSVAVKPPPAALAMGLGLGGAERTDSPWLRAAMLTPSVRGFMTATRLGTVDAALAERIAAQAGAVAGGDLLGRPASRHGRRTLQRRCGGVPGDRHVHAADHRVAAVGHQLIDWADLTAGRRRPSLPGIIRRRPQYAGRG